MLQIEKNVHNFENLGDSDLVIYVCLDLTSMYTSVKYEGSVINHVDSKGSYSEKEKWLPFKEI